MKCVIGFAGRKRSGKGVLCEHLRETKGATIVTVANALKQLCCELIGVETIDELNKLKDDPSMGLNLFKENAMPWTMVIGKSLGFIPEECKTYEDYDMFFKNSYDPKLLELAMIVSNYLDKKESTVRELLQFIGTDIIRHFNPNWHVERLIEAINNAPTELVVVDDVRFPNERKAIEDIGGIVFFVIRPDLSIDISNHDSEKSLFWYNFSDNRVIVNYDTESFLFENFDIYLNHDFNFSMDIMILKSGLHTFDNVNQMFGVDPSKEELELIETIINNKVFKQTGVINILSTNQKISNTFGNILYRKKLNYENGLSQILIWNPYVIENLKLYM